MSRQSEAVKRWRRNCKDRIIAAMGGACCVCGYNRCQSALALHHLDPSQKDIGLGAIRANPKNWNTIVEELRKCVLVCHVCHSEIHEGIREVPENAPKFNEEFVSYKKVEEKITYMDLEKQTALLTPCPVCSKLKSSHLINCSLECAGKAKRKIDWDKVDLQEELKTKSVLMLAEQLGCSDVAIHKRLKRLDLK